MRKNINIYPAAQAFSLEIKKNYECDKCKDTGRIVVEEYSERAREIYGDSNDAVIVSVVPCPECEARKARKLFEIHPKQPDQMGE